MLPEITRKIRVPRALDVPYPLGFPLGRAHDPIGQRRVLSAVLDLIGRDDVPLMEKFPAA